SHLARDSSHLLCRHSPLPSLTLTARRPSLLPPPAAARRRILPPPQVYLPLDPAAGSHARRRILYSAAAVRTCAWRSGCLDLVRLQLRLRLLLSSSP
ncbi:unnamed protein product, partial [Urochloa humidicola]